MRLPLSKSSVFIYASVNVLCLISSGLLAQVSYNAAVSYGLRKLNPNYTGNAVQIRRSCDNATKNIGFNSCGGFDTTTLRSFILVANPLSSISTSAAGAYSLRKLNCSYSGNAIRVRRSSDNATQDIAFTSDGDLDTATLKTFVGSNNGFVTIWYDQSGNSRNATQGTAGNQPRIITSGVIERQGGRPAIYFPGMGFGLFTGNLNIFTTNAMFNGVAKVNTDLTYNTIVNTTNSNIPAPIDHYNNQVVVGNGTSYTFFTPSQTFNAAKPLGIWTYNGTSGGAVNMYYNSTSILSGTASFFGSSNRPVAIGSRNDGVTGLNGWISEVVLFSSIPSATDRLFLEWTQSEYYNIGATSLGTLPANAATASIATWYDQSGNSRNSTQTTNSRQPLLVSSGAMQRIKTLPAITGSTASQTNLTCALGSTYSGSVLSALTVFQTDVSSTANLRIMSVGTGTGTADYNTSNHFNVNQRSTNQFVIERNSVTPSTTITAGSPLTLSVLFDGSVRQLFNSGAGSATPTDNSAFSFTHLRLLQSINPAFEATEAISGKMAEFSMYYSALSTTRRRIFESNQSAFYNITISNNKYTPPAALSYNLFVNGIGRESATDSVANTYTSSGMGLQAGQSASDFLKDNGDYITIGMSCATAGVSSSNISAPIVQRWTNDWYLNKTDVNSNNGTVVFYFDFSDYGVGGTPGNSSQYALLRRTSTAGTFSVVTGTTPSVSGDRVYFSVDASNIVTNNYYTIGTTNISSAPLPVELLSFKGERCDRNVCLNWATASEYNNNYFLIERSEDGINFSEIGKSFTKATNGNSNTLLNYSFTDLSPKAGINYYRLNQFDHNGDSKKSGIISVAFEDDSKSVSVYPNPNNGDFIIATDVRSETVLTISVTDVFGREVFSGLYENNEAGKIEILSNKQLAKGIYILRIKELNYSAKIIVE